MSCSRKNRAWRTGILSAFLSVLLTILLANTSCSPKPEMTRWQYDQLIDRVKSGQVEQVALNADLSQAIVITRNGQKAIVSLPPDAEFLAVLQQNKVSFSVSPSAPSLSPPLTLVLSIVSIGGFAFWFWVLIDCAMWETNVGNTKLVWVIILLFTNILGAVAYFFLRRPQRLRESS